MDFEFRILDFKAWSPDSRLQSPDYRFWRVESCLWTRDPWFLILECLSGFQILKPGVLIPDCRVLIIDSGVGSPASGLETYDSWFWSVDFEFQIPDCSVIYQILLSPHLCRAPTLLRFLLRFSLLFHPFISYLNPILSFTLWIILIFLSYPCPYSDICTIWLFLLSSLLWHFTPMFLIIVFRTFSELLFNKL